MNKCRICGWEGDGKRVTAREMMQGTKEEFVYFECGKCGCLQIEDIPEELEKYYGNDYYSYASFDGNVDDEKGKQPTDYTRVLDVGCGSGGFLCQMSKMGFVNLTGCDPFIEKDIEYPNGVHIYKKTIHEMSGEYDWIYLNDSFEHVQDPHEVMESIKKLLASKGIARVKLPIYPNVAFDMFGSNWYQLDAPRHIFLHTKESLEYLAKEHGLSVVKREYDSTNAQIVRSFLYSRDITFWEQTQDVVRQFFTDEDLKDIEESCQSANQNEYGDHAAFYLVHKRR